MNEILLIVLIALAITNIILILKKDSNKMFGGRRVLDDQKKLKAFIYWSLCQQKSRHKKSIDILKI